MSPRQPPTKPADAIRAFERLGFVVARRRGSHVMMKKLGVARSRQESPGVARPLVIPEHDELAIGTLRSDLRTAGISVEEFRKLLAQG